MTRHRPILLVLSIIAAAAWAYNVNYDTREALDRLSDLRSKIAQEREDLQVLRVEWAYLNAPDRLARLVARHNDELALVPMSPETFSYVAAVPYPRDAPHAPAPETAPEPAPEPLIASAGSEAPAGSAPPDAGPQVASAESPRGEPADMHAAVVAALAEVGIAVEDDHAGTRISAITAAGTVPVPAARPVAWTRP